MCVGGGGVTRVQKNFFSLNRLENQSKLHYLKTK